MSKKGWNEGIVINGVTFPSDELNRKQDADLLTKILTRRSNVISQSANKSSYVINVNAEWGAGKTYFIKRWAEDLKYDYPVVYIDAWSNDFMDSPIITVLAEIQEQLLDSINKSCLPRDKKKRFKNIGISILPKILAALVKRYGGFDIEDLFVEESSEESEKPASTNKTLDLSAAMEAMATQAFKEHSDYKSGVKELKATIKELIKFAVDNPKNSLSANKRSYPAFIFIDELDRCRPTYAVEMLEAIKHIFDIEGLVIVVSTHTEELQHTIKALYGNNFNADSYLRRFFDTKYHLDVTVSPSLLEINSDFSILNHDELNEKNILLFPFISQNNECLKRQVSSLLVSISNWKKLPPRSSIQLANRLLTSIELIDNEKSIDIIVLSVLLCLYMFSKSEFDYLCSTLRMEYFSFDEKATTLRISFEKLNLRSSLIEMTQSKDSFCSYKQLLEIPNPEKMQLFRLSSDFNNVDIYDYFHSFSDVMKRGSNVRRTGFLHTFDYDGRGSISNKQLMQAYMTFFGIHKASLEYYLDLINLTNKLSDS
jgi:hypothetical protein